MPAFKQTTSTLSWIALVIMLGFFLNWSFTNLIPTGQPGANSTPNQFICPVTEPNGNLPPYETVESPYYLGNGEIWTGLWPQGKIYMLPENREPDNSFSMKWWWWRAQPGERLTIEGHRLDANADPLRADIPDGYADYFQVAALIFPTTGCWEVTGRVGESSLTFVTEVVFDEATPAPPEPIVVTSIVTAPPEDGGYDWRDTKMYLAQPLPQSPIDAQVYALKLNQPVTKDDVLVLAQRFGIQGEVQELPPDFSNGIGYMLTDGTQKLEVQSNNHFVFYTNYPDPALGTVPEEQARTIIDGFLKKYGFNFEYHMEDASGVLAQQYIIIPLTSDGVEIRTDYLMPISYEFTIDGTGQVLAFSGFLLDYESLGTFQLITAEDAFQDAIADHPQFGHMEMFLGKNGGGGGGPGFYKLNLSGTPVVFPSPTAQPEINFGSGDYTVKAGDTLSVIAANHGITIDELMQANGLNDPMIFVDQKLIIPGTQSIAGQRIEGQRGLFTVNIFQKSDGSQRKEYLLSSSDKYLYPYFLIEGTGLDELEKYHNLPVDIWGTIDHIRSDGAIVVKVDRYEIPYPDLEFQIIQGTQKLMDIQGQTISTFTTADGKIYAQLTAFGDPDTYGVTGREGDQILVEAIIIPNETFGDYSALRVYGSMMAVSPKNGQANEMTITANQPNIMDEIINTEVSIPPTATIEKVELVYYTPDPRYGAQNPIIGPTYLQPAWRFYGHYSTGDEFEILVQALKQEFLLPELAPYTSPG